MLNLIFVCIFGEVLVNKLGVLVMEFSSGRLYKSVLVIFMFLGIYE